MEVHHVEQVRDRPDLAFDERNLVALCVSYHVRRHRRPETEAERRWRKLAEE